MRILRVSISILMVFSLLTPVIFSGGFENSGIGTKARGMSGAFRAIADDWTAAFYNPAGYADILDNQLGVNMAFVHYRNELNPDYSWTGGSDWSQPGIFSGSDINNFHEILSNPSAGFITRMPVWGETVFGFSVYQPFDYNVSWELYDHDKAYNDSLTMPGDQFRNNLDVIAFQITASHLFMEEKLSVGLGIQLLRADLVFNDLIFRDNPFWDNLGPGFQTFHSRKITEWNHNNGNGYGLGFRAGTVYKMNENLKVAFTANLPLSINLSGVAQLEYHMPRISGDSAAIANSGRPGQLFLSGSSVIDSAQFEADLDLPASIGMGLAYNMNEKLTIAADVELTFWSAYDGLFFEYSEHNGIPRSADSSEIARNFLMANASNPVDWKDAFKFMGGVSYDYSQVITLLGGVSIDQSPARDNEYITPQFVDIGSKLGLTGGLIFHINQWDLGITTSYVSQPDLTTTDLVDIDGDGAVDTFTGSYKADTYETIFSFNYRF